MPPQSIGGPANAAGCAKAVTGRAFPGIRRANRAPAVCSRARRGTRLSCRSPCSPAAPPPGRTAWPTTPATSSTPCATRAPTSRRWRSTPGRSARRGPRAACARCVPSWCTSSSRRRPSASRRGSGCCPTPSARRSSRRCTSTAGGRRPAGCRRRCGRRWNGGGRSTARPGGSPRRPPPSSRRTPRTPRRVAQRVDRPTVTIPLAPNVPDCGPVDAARRPRAARDPGRRAGRRVLRLRPPGQGAALPDRGRRAAARRATRACTCSCSAASPRAPCPPAKPTPSATSWSAGRSAAASPTS